VQASRDDDRSVPPIVGLSLAVIVAGLAIGLVALVRRRRQIDDEYVYDSGLDDFKEY
jgi:hypothetical protein